MPTFPCCAAIQQQVIAAGLVVFNVARTLSRSHRQRLHNELRAAGFVGLLLRNAVGARPRCRVMRRSWRYGLWRVLRCLRFGSGPGTQPACGGETPVCQ
jgi:hypothetical protein